MPTKFWKLSMGPGGSGHEFKDLLTVIDFIRQGLVLVHGNTGPKGALEGQGKRFVEEAAIGDHFYLCHGNEDPSVLLLGQLSGPPNFVSAWGHGWVECPFRWLKTSVTSGKYTGKEKWWAPNHPSTFHDVPDHELKLFQSEILQPYFELKLADFGVSL
jgi:hypothetical protein